MMERLRLLAAAAGLMALSCGTAQGGGAKASGGQGTGGQGQAGSGVAGSLASGGAGGNGGSSAGGSTGAKGPVLGDTPAEACIAYALAVCTRRDECNMIAPGNCLSASESCPDLAFSPGATRTVEGLKACAEAFKTLPCDQVIANKSPPCVTPGTRAQGEACSFPSQCSSLNCKMSGSGCGQCAKEVALHESCAGPDVDCQSGSECTGSAQTCEPSYLAPVGPNEACVQGSACVKDYFCLGVGQDGVCTALPKEGENCSPYGSCRSDNYCGPSRICRALPGMGQPCGVEYGQSRAYDCQAALVCHYAATAESGTCLPPPGAGEPCVFAPDMPQVTTCGTGLRCDDSVAPPTCVGPAMPGAACNRYTDCGIGSLCACPPSTPDCQDRHCQIARFAGERCDEPNTICHPAFSCEAGVCKPIPLRGLFGQTCPGP
jgi:hypothetical protein